KVLHGSLIAYHSNKEQGQPWHHVLHCLNVLRDEIMCDASDVPMYTGYQPDQASGLGQVRMCRDWGQLEAWAREHTACWRYVEGVESELDRYRFCPSGSPYVEVSQTQVTE
ncbi:MAG: hypothetical protein LQ340_007600, partial [Diploschistes diacapsis]